MRSSFIALSAFAVVTVGYGMMTKRAQMEDAFRSFSEESSPPFHTVASPGGVSEPLARTVRLAAAERQAPVAAAQPVVQPKTAALDTMTTAATNVPVDESALRYFASRGDTVRLQAEISRLKALYPNWKPPEDPLAVPENTDTQLENMWQLYSQARYAEVRKAIAERQANDATWQPPKDLIDRLSVAEARGRLVNASDLKQYETVVRIGAETPSLLTCSDVDVLWRVAEAFVRTDKLQRGKDAYLYILNNCENPAERLATVQKAAELIPYPGIEELLAREKALPDGKPEFDSIRDDLSRRIVADANKDPKLVAPPQYLLRLERVAETSGLAADALLLGWYHLQHEDPAAAEPWFRKARDKEDSASASQGLALVLIDRKEPKDAEDVMYTWRDASQEAKAVYLAATANLMAIDPPVALSSEVLQRIAAFAVSNRDAATAQQFGWYARALQQPQTAEQWFKTALQWKPDDEPSAYGLAITRLELGDEAGLAEIQAVWSSRSKRIAQAGEPPETENQKELAATRQISPGTDERAAPPMTANQPRVVRKASVATRDDVVSYQDDSEAAAVRPQRTTRVTTSRGCKTTIDPQNLTPDAALQRGWCLMDINRPLEAAAAFDVAIGSNLAQTREDAAYGQSLAYLRAGLSGKAAVAATRAPQKRERMAELQTAILADKALAAFDAGRYREALLILDQRNQIADERTDLMVLRGYAYMNLKRYPDARRIFEAAAATGNRDAARGLNALERATQPNGR